ncbi:hypothetical protein ACFL6O_03870 [candidate division KSB1 bacterium]
MQLFNSGFFWFIEGIILCVVIMAFSAWMKEKNIPMPLWKWFAFVIWIFFFGFTIAFIGTSIGENEANAAVKGGILFGIISIISGAGLWRLIKIGAGKAE